MPSSARLGRICQEIAVFCSAGDIFEPAEDEPRRKGEGRASPGGGGDVGRTGSSCRSGFGARPALARHFSDASPIILICVRGAGFIARNGG